MVLVQDYAKALQELKLELTTEKKRTILYLLEISIIITFTIRSVDDTPTSSSSRHTRGGLLQYIQHTLKI